jgi:hypothetical protein
MASRTRSGRNADAPPADGHLIAIRAQDKGKKRIEKFVLGTAAPIIARMARQWGYILRVRTRWKGDADMRDSFGEKAIKDLDALGIGRDAIQGLASFEHIEVELFDTGALLEGTKTPVLDAASEIPWEYLLSSATQYVGRLEPQLVTRCLKNKSKVVRRRPRNVLFVESAPGRIGPQYSFDDEEKRLSAALDLKEDHGLTFSQTDRCGELRAKLRTKAWDVVHVTGVDTHQAAWLVEDFYPEIEKKAEVVKDGADEEECAKQKVIDEEGCLHDGVILRGDHKSELPVRYDDLAGLLLQSRKPPGVVTLNLYYSGARTARELVARGVYAALGFLDQIDDEFAELFFQGFYWAWCRDKQSIRDAFLDAWAVMDGDRLHGTGIVIWSGRSMIGPSGGSAKRFARARRARRGGR